MDRVESIKLSNHHFKLMKLSPFFIALLLLLSVIGTVAAQNVNYTSNFTENEIVRVNQSTIQDPTGGQSEPWILWVMSGCIGIFLVVLSLIKPRLYRMDYEISIILSVMAWPFLWYWTWGCLTSIDYIVGASITTVEWEAVMITQHILYTFPILGWIGVGGCVAAVLITILLIGQFKLFKEEEEDQNQRQRSENQ